MLIEDHAFIGDGRSAALVARDGTIDWLCWPRFDSPALFAALLGDAGDGCWCLAPVGPVNAIHRGYREDSMVLETRFETPSGAVTLIDFMATERENPSLVRIVRGEAGRCTMRTDLILRFGYGAEVPWVTADTAGGIRAVAGPDMAVLQTDVPCRGEGMRTVAEFTVEVGQSVSFGLHYIPSHLELRPMPDAEDALAEAERFWRDWAARSRYRGPWSSQVMRSLLTLKAFIYEPTGGIVAAPTTSLPERWGGARNWDYRYCWLRDATLTLMTLMNAGYEQEAGDCRNWLLRAVAGAPDQLRTVYGVAGERRLDEWQADWLSGFAGSRPVRIGNAAHRQLQLDVYGEIMDALHQARRAGLPESEIGWQLQRALLRHLEQIWRQPDSGIWEVRGERRQFTYSKVMAWVAFDRAIKSAEQFGLDTPLEKWRQVRAAIHADVCEHGYDTELGSFVQVYGGKAMDASLLQLAALGFVEPHDPRFAGTVAAIDGRLAEEGLVRRYNQESTHDGIGGGEEGIFVACSFWLVDAYLLLGRHDDARRLFERLLRLCNDVGLLAEEYDPRARRQLGNFPQAFSHIALINSANNLAASSKPARERGL
ncbi:MAG: glycoside hydrolase family 15 protein [Geminicoccaceae bacterium]